MEIKDTRIIDVQETTEALENGHAGITASASEKRAGLLIQLKCIYINAHSISNKKEEVDAMLQQENWDIVAITETW